MQLYYFQHKYRTMQLYYFQHKYRTMQLYYFQHKYRPCRGGAVTITGWSSDVVVGIGSLR
jgi:hypothetical protein